MISLFISGQQRNLGQHQLLRRFGILTEIKIKNNQLGKAVAGTKIKRRGKMSCEPEFPTTAKIPWFHFQLQLIKITETAQITESQSDYKENSLRIVHWKSNSTRVVT